MLTFANFWPFPVHVRPYQWVQPTNRHRFHLTHPQVWWKLIATIKNIIFKCIEYIRTTLSLYYYLDRAIQNYIQRATKLNYARRCGRRRRRHHGWRGRRRGRYYRHFIIRRRRRRQESDRGLSLSGWWRGMIYRFCDPKIHLIICLVVILHPTASALLFCYSPHTAFYSIWAIIGLKVILRPSKGKKSRCTKNIKISFTNACHPNKIFLAHDKWTNKWIDE